MSRPAAAGPTPREDQVLRYVRRHIQAFDQAPTRAEIGRAFSISRPTVEQHLQALQVKGRLVLTKQWRGIALRTGARR